MKKNRMMVCLFILLLSIAGLFGPYVSVNNTTIRANDLIFASLTSVYSYVLLLPYILFFVCGILLLFDKKAISYTAFILSIVACVIFFLTPFIISLMPEYKNDNISMGSFTLVIGICALALTLYYSGEIFSANQFTISDIVEIAMLVALAIILDLPIFKIRISLTGGSISLAMLPLIILCLRKGFVKGFISCGIIYGLLDCMIDGYGFITFPLDYLLGFGLLALVGLFRKWIFNKKKKVTFMGVLFLILSLLVAMVGRTLASTLSGIFIYEMTFWPSLVYQLTYIGPSFFLVLVVLLILYKPLLVINERFPQKS
ncbi:MAG: energy-coupled thiamine transporter ThiT [Coprobacillus sp.]|nr:energy-coupled thiamine transporter ThiT [Coprobacillus sp.]